MWLLLAVIIAAGCSGHRALTRSLLVSARMDTSDLVGHAGYLGDDLLLTPVVQERLPVGTPDSSRNDQFLVLRKMTKGEITQATNDTIQVLFANDLLLSFCRNPEQMDLDENDDTFYLNLMRVRHMDGTKSFVIKSGSKLYLPSFTGWNCRLLVDKAVLNPKE